METVDDHISRDLGIDREQLQGLCALWVMGAKPEDLAAGLGVSHLILTWYLIAARKTELDELEESTVHYKDSNQSTM